MMLRAAPWTAIMFAAALAGAAAASEGRGLVCMAATKPADAGKPLADIDSLEFYADEGNPALSYSFPLTLVQSLVDPEGRTRNTYRIRNEPVVGATIVFAGETPLSFAVGELARTYTSLAKNNEETEFMADAVPGIVCYSVTFESEPL
jgi:hypothetical protein